MPSGGRKEDWGRLYYTDVLAKTTVHAAAAVYRHDIYVDRELSLATAAAVRNLEVWETDEYHHDGIADYGEVIFERLLSMTRREPADNTGAFVHSSAGSAHRLCPVQEVGWNDKGPRTMCRVPRVHDW